MSAILFGVWFCILIALAADDSPPWARKLGGALALLTFVAVPMAAYYGGMY